MPFEDLSALNPAFEGPEIMDAKSKIYLSEQSCGTLPPAAAVHIPLLTKDEAKELFVALRDKLDWNKKGSNKASECFFGAIIGGDGLEHDGNSVEVEGKVYRLNDRDGKTRKILFEQLSKLSSARKVINAAEKLLRKRVLHSIPSELRNNSSELRRIFSELRLQCNINAYSIHQQLDWHRDEPVRGRKATSYTFWPGSATLFLLDPECKLEGGSFIYRKMYPEESDEVFYYEEGADPGPNYPERLQSAQVNQGVLVAIFDRIYSHGIHRNDKLIDTPPGSVSTDAIVRISLNFRYLRKSAFLACNGDPKVW